MLYTMVKERSVWFSLWSSQRFSQTWVKLGQLRSNLVNSGQNSLNSRKCISDHVLRVFGYTGPHSDQKRLRSNFGQTWPTLIKLGQPWSNLVRFQEMCPGPHFEVIWCDEPSSDQAGLVRAVSFCVSIPEKIPWVKMRLWQQGALCIGESIGNLATLPMAERICHTYRSWVLEALERTR